MRETAPQMATGSVDRSITVVCLMSPRPETAATLRASLTALVQPTRTEPGSLAYDIYEEPEGSILLVETWASQRALTAHQQQPAVRAVFGEDLPGLLAEPMRVHYGHPLKVTAEG